jgi:hypothetical protein
MFREIHNSYATKKEATASAGFLIEIEKLMTTAITIAVRKVIILNCLLFIYTISINKEFSMKTK